MIFWTDLISTADLGCPSCTLLLKGIKSFVPATELENIKNVELHLYTESEPQARLRPGRRSAPMVVVQFWEVHNLTIRLEFYTDDGESLGLLQMRRGQYTVPYRLETDL
jgi:hypothetical protein